eukprot:gene15972-20405_t
MPLTPDHRGVAPPRTARHTSAPPMTADAPDSGRTRLLMIDDDKKLCRLVSSYLEPLGFKVAYTPWGIIVALTFITLPFVVRTLQPVIEDIETEVEEAAASLGASRWQTFVKVIFP